MKLILPHALKKYEPRRHVRDGETVVELYAPGTAGNATLPADGREDLEASGEPVGILYTFGKPKS